MNKKEKLTNSIIARYHEIKAEDDRPVAVNTNEEITNLVKERLVLMGPKGYMFEALNTRIPTFYQAKLDKAYIDNISQHLHDETRRHNHLDSHIFGE